MTAGRAGEPPCSPAASRKSTPRIASDSMPAPSAAPPAVLTFAATDPTSGAGLQADILTLASMGCHPLSVVTAITVQDSAGVEGFLALDPDWVADQARCILEDIPVVAFKVGVLGSSEIVTVVAEIVSDYPDIPLVLDPVLASGRGDEFGGEDLVGAIRELLVPQSTVVTPEHPGAAPAGAGRRRRGAGPRRMRAAPARRRLRVRPGHGNP